MSLEEKIKISKKDLKFLKLGLLYPFILYDVNDTLLDLELKRKTSKNSEKYFNIGAAISLFSIGAYYALNENATIIGIATFLTSTNALGIMYNELKNIYKRL